MMVMVMLMMMMRLSYNIKKYKSDTEQHKNIAKHSNTLTLHSTANYTPCPEKSGPP